MKQVMKVLPQVYENHLMKQGYQHVCQNLSTTGEMVDMTWITAKKTSAKKH